MPLQRIVALPSNTGSTFFKGFTGSDDRSPSPTSHKILAVSAHEGLNKALKKFSSARKELYLKDDKAIVRSQVDEVTAVNIAAESLSHREYNCTRALQPKLLRVAVDVDEVLGSFLSSLNRFIAEQHFMHYDLSEYHVYDFMKIWGCSQAEANDRVHAFFESEHFKDGIVPIAGAHRSLVQLAEFCDLVVVTSRQHVIRHQTLDWIDRHYPGIFSDVYFGNHFALEGEARPKSEICRSIGAEVLIDDNPRYAVECAQHNIEVLLFDHNNKYPWSKTSDGPVHPLITRVQSWEDVESILLACADGKR
ncbi:hypothetical protein GOP47_0013331 [Adiantum capillus-veneris]|uniref:Uncharacterized protein n=1 Tax=Adiantum capillus-veneris TaxID=13818 RepID=A0A9D4ZF70_ADICA|nr:hypothetical protein GOP47_0013331 [Adiantum capillus-veneris]